MLFRSVLLLTSRDRNRLYFFICGVSMIASVAPRFDVVHLVFAVPLFYPVAAAYILKARWTVWPVVAFACLFLLGSIVQRSNLRLLDTPIGRVRISAEGAETVRWLTSNIHPGERLFAYSYLPMAYFVTRAQNVSRFAFLQPGVFTLDDERLAVEDMVRKPPRKVLYVAVAKEEFLRIFPSSDPERLQLHYLHNFVEKNFQRVESFKKFHLYIPRVPVRSAE